MKGASVYARLGWRLIPILPGEKRPAISDWVNAASNDPAQLEAWATEFPSANLGVITGVSFFVLDVDPRNGGDQSLAALVAEHGLLPLTVEASTPSGGSHYLFKLPNFAVTNSAGKIGPGLDIRGAGGQIVIAPSRTEAGKYQWVHAPWSMDIAEAPEWLISALGRAPVRTTPQTSDARGFFPAATPDDLEAAAESLSRHGPAIEGQGGDTHTFRACAILSHDYALSDAEAWPVLSEWNETCQPPWDESDLRAKLAGGEKYGSAEYGCKRTLDTVAAARKLIRDWEATGSTDPVAMIQRVRDLPFRDPAARALIEADLIAATGMKPKDLAIPKARVPAEPLVKGEIHVNHELHKIADAAAKSFVLKVFQRNGVLCEVVKGTRQMFIYDLEANRILDLMSGSATYTRNDPQQGKICTAPPSTVAGILHARRTYPDVRILEAVTSAPIFLSDGSILSERGYNAAARVYLEPSVSVNVPDEPTRNDARAAVRLFRDLLGDFKFAEVEDFSSWLAALLSPLVKAATGNAPAPLVCISAASPGAGKSLLTEVIAQIVTGGSAEIRPYNPRDPGEWGKRLTAFVKAASPVSVFDNCNGPIGDEGLDRLITSSTWSDRILGASEAPPLPNVSTWLATGNNIEPVGDTVRRVLMVRIEVDTERPQERTGFKRPLLADYAAANRSELLSAALTILRAYHVAERPDQSLAAWGSFTAWSSLVRAAIVWTGLPDPFLTQQRAARELSEPENDAHDFWISVVSASDGAVASITTLANQRDAQGVLGAREPITPLHLRRFLGRFIDKPRGDRRIRREQDKGSTRYYVEAVAR